MASATEQAVRRLEAALLSLERALEGRAPRGPARDDVSAEVENLTADRAQLAESLDQSQARVARLEGVNREASRRIETAVETIRAVLTSEGEGP
jgi:hypothetical protein